MVRKVSAEREQRRVAFARDLGEAIRASGLTLDVIAQRLADDGHRVSVATLSYWQNGQTLPTRGSSRDAVGLLETILEVQQGTLSRHVSESVGRYPRVDPEDRVEEVVAAMGLSLERRLRLLASHERLEVQQDRRSAHEWMRQYMRAEFEVTQSSVMVLVDPDGGPPVVEAGEFCQVVQRVTDESLGLSVVELRFPRALRRGDQFWFEYEVDWGPGREDRDVHTRMVGHPTGLLAFDIVFRCDPPRQAWYTVESEGRASTRRAPVDVVQERIQAVLTDLAPGEHSIHWQW